MSSFRKVHIFIMVFQAIFIILLKTYKKNVFFFLFLQFVFFTLIQLCMTNTEQEYKNAIWQHKNRTQTYEYVFVWIKFRLVYLENVFFLVDIFCFISLHGFNISSFRSLPHFISFYLVFFSIQHSAFK